MRLCGLATNSGITSGSALYSYKISTIISVFSGPRDSIDLTPTLTDIGNSKWSPENRKLRPTLDGDAISTALHIYVFVVIRFIKPSTSICCRHELGLG
jgi:hypothetical protein